MHAKIAKPVCKNKMTSKNVSVIDCIGNRVTEPEVRETWRQYIGVLV